MWVFLIFVWLLVLGWGFFFCPCGIIFILRGETSWIQDVVFRECWVRCAFRLVFANKPSTDYSLRSSLLYLYVAHIAAAWELKLQELSKAIVNFSCIELRGAACTCHKLQAAPKLLHSERQGQGEQLLLVCKEVMLPLDWDDDSFPVTFLQTCPT